MESIADSNPMISTALRFYNKYHQSPELRMIAEGHERFVRDAQALAETAEARGEAKGWAEGKAEGEAEGKAKGKAEIALFLLKEGMGMDFVMRATGLSEQEIAKLADRSEQPG